MTDTGNDGSLWPRAGEWTYPLERNGVVESEWIRVVNAFHNRIYIGTDVNEVKGWDSAWNKRIVRFRKILSQFSPESQDSIAYKTAQSLYAW